MPLRNAILFDLDGTLVDTAPDLHGALNATLEHLGRDGVSLEHVRHMVGMGARVLVERGLAATAGRDGADAGDEETVNAAVRHFFDHYRAHLADLSRPFPGVVECLKELSSTGARLAVCTNKPYEFAAPLIEQLGMGGYFQAILGGDSLPMKKPYAGHILGTIEAMGGNPARAVMVGDSATDVEAARNADIPVVVVSFGYTQVPAHELGADAVIDHFDQLHAALARLSE